MTRKKFWEKLSKAFIRSKGSSKRSEYTRECMEPFFGGGDTIVTEITLRINKEIERQTLKVIKECYHSNTTTKEILAYRGLLSWVHRD